MKFHITVLNNKIYTLLLSFIKVYLIMTKWKSGVNWTPDPVLPRMQHGVIVLYTHLESFNEPLIVRFCMTLETLINWELSSLKEHDFVIIHFQIYFNKTCSKVCVLLFNSCGKFYAKICTRCWNVNKSLSIGPLLVKYLENGEICWTQKRSEDELSIVIMTCGLNRTLTQRPWVTL